MTSFNLIDEPWIPCLAQGDLREMSIRNVLHRAEAIEAIEDSSPLTTVTMYRLLIAILHRVFGPSDDTAWGTLWRDGWNRGDLDDYLSEWHQRFDLFDPQRPFYQNAEIQAEPAWASKLTHELGPANRPLFSHVDVGVPHALTPAQAARYLLAYNSFSPGGLITPPKNLEKSLVKHYKFARAAPLTASAVSLVQGENLRETLLLNMVPYKPEAALPFAVAGEDLPAWERHDAVQMEERRPDGYLDWLTWQSRRITLIPSGAESGPVVEQVVIMKGNQLPANAYEYEYEQMVAYRENKNAKMGTADSPYWPIGFRPERAVWRDSETLFHPRDGRRPRTLTYLAQGRRQHAFGTRRPLDLYGVSLDQFNALFWRHERLPLPAAYLTDDQLRGRLQTSLALADGSGRVLRDAAKKLATELLAPGDERTPDPKAVANMLQEMAPERRYWAQLEAPFDRYLLDQADERREDAGEDATYGTLSLWIWADTVRTAARESFRQVANGAGTGGWALKAAVEAEGLLRGGLARVRKEQHVDEQSEEAA